MSAIKNLKKAYQSQAITKDTHTLQEYHVKQLDKKTNTATMILVGMETKYIPSFEGKNGNRGYRTRFFLENGETVGTFSNAANEFFLFFARLMGHDIAGNFLHIDVNGKIKVDVSKIDLDGSKTTYNFEIVEEGSELNGFSDYLPNSEEIFKLEEGK